MNKLVERRKKWNFTPFPYELVVILSSDVKASFDKRFTLKRSNHCSALTMCRGDRSTMFLSLTPPINTVAHEVTHVVKNLQEYIGAEHEEEFVAYYTGWLVSEIAKFALEKPLDKKKKVRYTKKVEATQTHAVVSST